MNAKVHFSQIPAAEDQFNMQAVRDHVAKKAGYHKTSDGVYRATGVFDRICNWVMGNAATDRYMRGYFEANQHAAMGALRGQYLERITGRPVDLKNDKLLSSRVRRQDFIRFNKGMRNHNKGKGDFTIPHKFKGAVAWSRVSHFLDGFNELVAAPTGITVKLTKLVFVPNMKEHSIRSYARLVVSLPFIGIAVGIVTGTCLVVSLGRLLRQTGLTDNAVNALGGLSALNMFAGSFSYLSGMVSWGAMSNHAELSDEMVAFIDNNKQRYLQRISTLIGELDANPAAFEMVKTAITHSESGVGRYRDQNERRTDLLGKLVESVRNTVDPAERCAAIESVLGEHMTAENLKSPQGSRLLEAGEHKQSGFKNDMREINKRCKDIVKITNLIEHSRTETHINHQEDKTFRNHRTNLEARVVDKNWRGNLYGGVAKVVDTMGAHKQAEKIRFAGSSEQKAYIKHRESLPPNATGRVHSVDRILSHPHQYGLGARIFARVVQSSHVLSFGVAMSTNYLVTRPFAAFHRAVERGITGGMQGRHMSFSAGRAASGAIWVLIETLAFPAIAAAAGLSGHAGFIAHSFNDTDKIKLLNWYSTGQEMAVISGIGALVTIAVNRAVKYSGSYKGDFSKSYDFNKQMKTLGVANPRAKYVSW